MSRLANSILTGLLILVLGTLAGCSSRTAARTGGITQHSPLESLHYYDKEIPDKAKLLAIKKNVLSNINKEEVDFVQHEINRLHEHFEYEFFAGVPYGSYELLDEVLDEGERDQFNRMVNQWRSINIQWDWDSDGPFVKLKDPFSPGWIFWERTGTIEIPGYTKRVRNDVDADVLIQQLEDVKKFLTHKALREDIETTQKLIKNATKEHNVLGLAYAHQVLHDLDYWILNFPEKYPQQLPPDIPPPQEGNPYIDPVGKKAYFGVTKTIEDTYPADIKKIIEGHVIQSDTRAQDRSIKTKYYPFNFDEPISREEAEKILGRAPADMTNYFKNSGNQMRQMGETLYRATEVGRPNRLWVGQMWFRTGNSPGSIMITETRATPEDGKMINEQQKIKLSNGILAELIKINNAWYRLSWINNGVVYIIDANNIDEQELIDIANAIK